MSNLSKFSKEELAAEMARRNVEEKEAEAIIRRAGFQILVDNKDALLALFPEHNRTTCSDVQRHNGFYTRSDNGPRCTRCALLDLSMHFADNFDFDLVLTFRYVEK